MSDARSSAAVSEAREQLNTRVLEMFYRWSVNESMDEPSDSDRIEAKHREEACRAAVDNLIAAVRSDALTGATVKESSTVPDALRSAPASDLIDKLEAAHAEVCEAVKRQWDGKPAFRLSIPANPQHDSDLLIGDALIAAIAAQRSPDARTAFEAGWQPIETAPQMRKIIVFYVNALGNGRCVMACYYKEHALEMHDDYAEVGIYDEASGSSFAPAGWYEEHDSDDPILALQEQPTHWMPLPAPPITASSPAQKD